MSRRHTIALRLGNLHRRIRSHFKAASLVGPFPLHVEFHIGGVVVQARLITRGQWIEVHPETGACRLRTAWK